MRWTMVLVIFMLFRMSNAQRCCTWSGLEEALNSPSVEEGLSKAPKVPPGSTCSESSYSWSSCPSGCTTLSCTGVFQGSSTTVYAGACDPKSLVTPESLKQLLTFGRNGVPTTWVGTCKQSAGTIETVLTVETVTASAASGAASGSVSGSIIGTLIVAVVTWFINSFGEIILKFLMGRFYDQIVGSMKKKYLDLQKRESSVGSCCQKACFCCTKKIDEAENCVSSEQSMELTENDIKKVEVWLNAGFGWLGALDTPVAAKTNLVRISQHMTASDEVLL